MVSKLAARDEIRRRLNADRVWSLYALADLDDGLFPHCDWYASGSDGLALVFHGISIRPIIMLGGTDTTRELLRALPVDSGYLNLQAHQLPAAEGLWNYAERHAMHRMVVDQLLGRPAETIVLGPEHESEVRQLYATGDGGGIAFAPFQLATGFFRGVRRQGELVAVGGVHVVSEAEGVAGVGNIFTRPDSRGQGLAQAVTAAVVNALRAARIPTIALNVEDHNAPAIAAYQRLGFRTVFTYIEGPAQRASSSSSSPVSRVSS